ncbi:MAG: hypothetical protein M5U08_03625 [Burkholderiales bacterium]|nr:hypothetical protein [Burkholderiales bacterium]
MTPPPGTPGAGEREVAGDLRQPRLALREVQRDRGGDLALHRERTLLEVHVGRQARELDLLALRLDRRERELGVDRLLAAREFHRGFDRLAARRIGRKRELRHRDARLQPLRFRRKRKPGEIDALRPGIERDVALRGGLDAGEARGVAACLQVEARKRDRLRLEVDPVAGA